MPIPKLGKPTNNIKNLPPISANSLKEWFYILHHLGAWSEKLTRRYTNRLPAPSLGLGQLQKYIWKHPRLTVDIKRALRVYSAENRHLRCQKPQTRKHNPFIYSFVTDHRFEIIVGTWTSKEFPNLIAVPQDSVIWLMLLNMENQLSGIAPPSQRWDAQLMQTASRAGPAKGSRPAPSSASLGRRLSQSVLPLVSTRDITGENLLHGHCFQENPMRKAHLLNYLTCRNTAMQHSCHGNWGSWSPFQVVDMWIHQLKLH